MINASAFVASSSSVDFAIPSAGTNPYGRNPFDALPSSIRRRIETLQQQEADAAALRASTNNSLEAAREARRAALRNVEIYSEDRKRSNNQRPAGREETLELERLARTEQEIRRLTELCDVRTTAWSTLHVLVENLTGYIHRLGGDAISPFTGPAPTLPTPPSVDLAREAVMELKAQLHQVRSAPRPSSEAKRRLRQHFAALAERGQPDASSFLDELDFIRWPMKRIEPTVSIAGNVAVSIPGQDHIDVEAVLAWLHGPAILKKLEEQITELADDSEALTVEDRAARQRELLAALLEAERAEVAAVEATPGATFRSDTDPRALLGLASTLPAPAGDA